MKNDLSLLLYGLLFICCFSIIIGATKEEPIVSRPDTSKANRIYKFEMLYDSALIRYNDSITELNMSKWRIK